MQPPQSLRLHNGQIWLVSTCYTTHATLRTPQYARHITHAILRTPHYTSHTHTSHYARHSTNDTLRTPYYARHITNATLRTPHTHATLRMAHYACLEICHDSYNKFHTTSPTLPSLLALYYPYY